MDENVQKMIDLIKKLPVDKITIIAEQCKSFMEVSPRVQKIVDLVNKLSQEEQDQFFSIINENNGQHDMEQQCVGVWPVW